MIISTRDYSNNRLSVKSSDWLAKVFKSTPNKWMTTAEQIRKIEYKYYNGSPGWELIGIKVCDSNTTDEVTGDKFSTVTVKLAFRRNHQFYSLTLIIPIIMLTILTPLGLILPGEFTE